MIMSVQIEIPGLALIFSRRSKITAKSIHLYYNVFKSEKCGTVKGTLGVFIDLREQYIAMGTNASNIASRGQYNFIFPLHMAVFALLILLSVSR